MYQGLPVSKMALSKQRGKSRWLNTVPLNPEGCGYRSLDTYNPQKEKYRQCSKEKHF